MSRIQILYPIIVGYVFWGKVTTWKLVLWCLASMLVYIARIVLTLQYRKRPDSDNSPWKWGRLFTATSIFSGFLWGYAAWLFYTPAAQTELVLLYTLIIGTAAGAVMISSYWMPGYLWYAIPSVSLMALSLFYHGDQNERILGFMLLLLLLMLITVALKSREQGYGGIRLRFENLDLIEKLNIEKNRAEDANRAKTQFLASANHDLRQPVHALSLLSYSLKDELHSQRGTELYTQLDQTVANLNSLLESLLDLSQLEAGALKVTPENIALHQVAAQLQSEFLSLCGQKGLSFRIRPYDGTIRTDHTLLIRLLRNLLTNAVRYTDEGGILLAFRPRAGQLSIEIWDTGIGIDAKHQQDVFREFFQVSNHTRKTDQGLGLGLSICQKIASLLELQLSMSSVPGRGTVFRVELPLLTGADASAASIQNEPISPEDHACFDHLKVLLIDDDLIGLGALSQVLSSFGMETILAQTTERAHTLLDSHSDIDLVVSDYRLSEQSNGVELVNDIRNRPGLQTVPALIITGDTAPDVLELIQGSGIPFINKPVQPQQLADQLSELLPPP